MDKAIYFKGKNCVVCQNLLPKIRTHFSKMYPKLFFEEVQIEDYPEIAAQYNVFTIPVLLIFFEGKEHFRFVRNFSNGEINEILLRTYRLRFE